MAAQAVPKRAVATHLTESALSGRPLRSSHCQPRKLGRSNLAVSADLCFLTHASNRPHPEKIHRGGEDAWFVQIDPSGGSFGVADGVGGYEEYGVDPGLYARNLMLLSERSVQAQAEPQQALASAHAATELPGACTACVIQLDGRKGKMMAANIGDSGFRIIRNGKLVLSSPPLQHYFDCPLQLCWDGQEADVVSDTADDADLYDIEVQEGDVLVAASDGLFDNVFPEDLVEVVNAQLANFQSSKLDGVKAAAIALSGLAQEHAADDQYDSPYAKECTKDEQELLEAQKKAMSKKVGAFGGLANIISDRLLAQEPCVLGGKMDDITVLVAMVVDGDKEGPALQQAADQASQDLKTTRSRLETALKLQEEAEKKKAKKVPAGGGLSLTEEEILAMDKTTLQNILQENGLPTSGKIGKLQQRVAELCAP